MAGQYSTLVLLPIINRRSVFMIKENNNYWMFTRWLCGYFQTMKWEEENICFQEVDVKRKNLEAVEVENM